MSSEHVRTAKLQRRPQPPRHELTFAEQLTTLRQGRLEPVQLLCAAVTLAVLRAISVTTFVLYEPPRNKLQVMLTVTNNVELARF